MNVDFENILKDIKSRYQWRRISPILEEASYKTANDLFIKTASLVGRQPYDSTATSEIINRLVHWTYNTSIDGIDCNKGFLLRGNTGRGKTLLMLALQEFLKFEEHYYIVGKHQYRINLTIVSARDIAFQYNNMQGDADIIGRYAKEPCLCIDDIGSEPQLSSNYGNKCSVVSEILERRDRDRLLTFATTNLPKLEERYDDRIMSRMHSLFNSYKLSHDTDFRQSQKQ